MKKLTTALVTLLAGSLWAFAGCSSEDTELQQPTVDSGVSPGTDSGVTPEPDAGDPAPDASTDDASVDPPVQAAAFFQRHRAAEQTFSLDNAAGGTITAAGGTRIVFPPAALRRGDAAAGTVSLRITEILDKRQLLLSGLSTESQGTLLESGGQLRIEASEGEQAVTLAPDTTLGTSFPGITGQDPANMQVFERVPDATGSFTTWGLVRGQLGRDGDDYVFDLGHLGWTNIDRFVNEPGDKTDVEVQVDPGSQTLSDVVTAVVFRDRNITVGLHYVADSQRFTSNYGSYADLLPVGAAVRVFAIGQDAQGALVIDVHDANVAADDSYTLAPHTVTEAEAEALLADL